MHLFGQFLLNFIMTGTQAVVMLLLAPPESRRSRFFLRNAVFAVIAAVYAAVSAVWMQTRTDMPAQTLISTGMFLLTIAWYFVCCRGAILRDLFNVFSGMLIRLAASSLANFPLFLLPNPSLQSGVNWLIVPLIHLLGIVLLLFLLDRWMLQDIRENSDFVPSKLSLGIMAALITIMLAYLGFTMEQVPEAVAYGIRALFCLLMMTMFYAEWKQARVMAQNALEKRIDEEKLRHYEDLGSVIQAMNIKAHDLRHQIRTLETGSVVTPEVISDLTETVLNYESYIKTGNDTLDVLLTEAALRCERADIEADFRVDGTCLGFLSAADLNALFGNAIDNAIEYLSKLPRDDRLLWVMGGRTDGFIRLRFENRLLTPVALENGVPRTTKADTLSHGFGTQSILSIARKYGGSASFAARDEVFTVCVILPARNQTDAGTN